MSNKNLEIALELSDFSELKTKAFYIDKTLFIRDLCYDHSKVKIITRPRLFGKSLNLSMVKYFFDITKDSTNLFKDTLIYDYPDIISEYMNKYPVIHINFSSCSASSFDGFIKNFNRLNSLLFSEYQFILKSELIHEIIKKDFNNILNETASLVIQKFSLGMLTEILFKFYDVRPMILIDDYDSPFDAALENGYYSELRYFMTPYLSRALKDNISLENALIVGCKNVPLGHYMNHVMVYGFNEKDYNSYFGFTEDEVKKALKEANLDTFDEVKHWYDGYTTGGLTIYNPWSILNYLKKKEFKPYWVNKGNENLFYLLLNRIPDMYYNLTKLVRDGSIMESYNYGVLLEVSAYKSSLYYVINALYLNGYLNMTTQTDDFHNEFKLVNNEVKYSVKEFLNKISKQDLKDTSYINDFNESFFNFDFNEAQRILNCMLTFKKNNNDLFLYNLLYYIFSFNKDNLFDIEIIKGFTTDFLQLKNKDRSCAFVIILAKSIEEVGEHLDRQVLFGNRYKTYDDFTSDCKYVHKIFLIVRKGNASLKLLDNKEYNYAEKYKDISKYLYSENKG